MADQEIVDQARTKMEQTITFLGDNLKGLRTGRPTPALVENIKVEAYGSPMPLNQLATITVPDPRSLLLQPFDASLCASIEKGILKSDVGITPESDGKVVRLAIPQMSQEQRDKMCARVGELAEETRVAIRNIRRDQNKAAETKKKSGELSEDLERDTKEAIQKVTKEMESEVDTISTDRVKQIQEG
ncbi:MAG: ribosome recycling factor [Planctomycetota bacterium]|nr:ribosome recycling factor [Planctomycetota bacterium]